MTVLLITALAFVLGFAVGVIVTPWLIIDGCRRYPFRVVAWLEKWSRS